jgi:hypothetical protein
MTLVKKRILLSGHTYRKIKYSPVAESCPDYKKNTPLKIKDMEIKFKDRQEERIFIGTIITLVIAGFAGVLSIFYSIIMK